MRLPSNARKAVVFIGPYRDGEFKACGTAFYMSGKLIDRIPCTYLVTARHVARMIDAGGVIVRVNTVGGDSREEDSPRYEWVFHEDEHNVDVAVAIAHPQPGDDVLALPIGMMISDFKQKTKRIEPGTPVYIAGLFNLFAGQKKNIPVVHTGHVALLPDDEAIPVRDKLTGRDCNVHGYLVNAQTLDGSSGSPVFVRRSVKTLPLPHPHEDSGIFPEAFGSPFLLGLWQGAWQSDPDKNLQENFGLGANRRVPVSFGIVERAQRIKDILESPTMAEKRRKMRDGPGARSPQARLGSRFETRYTSRRAPTIGGISVASRT